MPNTELVVTAHKTVQVSEDEWRYMAFNLKVTSLTTIAEIQTWLVTMGLKNADFTVYPLASIERKDEDDKDDLPF